MKTMSKLKSSGFTLVEVIITIVVAAIVGTMLVSVLGTSMTKSSEPIARLQASLALQQVMENITAFYCYKMKEDFTYPLSDLQTAIGGGVAGGNEGSTQNNSYGQYAIVYNHFIKFTTGQTETPGSPTDNLLKVTIKNGNNETLTKIFVQ